MRTPSAQRRPLGAHRWVVLILPLAMTILLSVTSSAGAAYRHNGQTEFFGADGTSSSANFMSVGELENIEAVKAVEFDQARSRLYVLRSSLVRDDQGNAPPQIPRGIYAFDMSTPGVHPPVGAGFPASVLQAAATQPYLAPDESEGRTYYVDIATFGSTSPYGYIYGYDNSGLAVSGFPATITAHPIGPVAVDPKGFIWIVTGQVFHKYDPNGQLVATVEPSLSVSEWGVMDMEFDSTTGNLWVLFSGPAGPGLARLTEESGYTEADRFFLSKEVTGSFPTFAVDGTDHTLYLVQQTPTYGTDFVALTETGGVIERFNSDTGHLYAAVNERTGELYTVNGRWFNACFSRQSVNYSPYCGYVGVFAGEPIPDVRTDQPTGIGHDGATLQGHLDPVDGPAASECQFEYVQSSMFNARQKISVVGATGGTYKLYFTSAGYSDPIPFNASAAELEATLNKISYFNGNVEVTGATGGPYELEYMGALAGRSGGSVYTYPEDLTPSGASVKVETTRPADTGWDYAATTPCTPTVSPASPASGPTEVSAAVSGLETGAEYRYRLVAANSNGKNLAAHETFTPQPSLVQTGDATAIAREAATLNGTIDPEGLATTYYFEYGHTPFYGQLSAAKPGSSLGTTTPGAQPAAAPLSGLEPGRVYHYRLVAVNSKGTSYGLDRSFTTVSRVKDLSTGAATQISRSAATLNGSLDPDGMQTDYYFEWGLTRRYGNQTAPPPGADVGTTAPGQTPLSAPIAGLQTDTTYHYRLVASNATYGTAYGPDRTFKTLTAVIGMQSDPATEITPTSATLNGSLDPDGLQTSYYFEWGKTREYGFTIPAPPGAEVPTTAPGATPLAAALSDLEPGTTYHYRLLAANSYGSGAAPDRTFTTPQGPSIEGLWSAGVSAAGAELRARIDPNGYQTKYRFEYGTTLDYGSIAPLGEGVLGPADSAQSVAVQLEGLAGVTYHFRLVAESQWGVSRSEDQTFDFNPPSCPNATVRQQTGAAYLPDCRAYEIVSSPRAGGSALIAEGPSSASADDRFAYAGLLNVIPGAGNPPNGGVLLPVPDLYVASRTAGGWVSRSVGAPGDLVQTQGGPPVETPVEVVPGMGVLADAGLNHFLSWDNSLGSRSYAPYHSDSQGALLGRLPTNIDAVPEATKSIFEGGFLGEGRPSADFGHYAFSSVRTAFAPGARATAPGSAYDNDLEDGSVSVISKTAAGNDLPQFPEGGLSSAEYIHIPAVSEDGSHILMGTNAAPNPTQHGALPPLHLYMRLNGAVTYELTLGADGLDHGVTFNGMTADGSQVFFTTAAKMSADDHDTSDDLYRWSENGGAPQLTRLSQGDKGAGDKDSCSSEWTVRCGVQVVPTERFGKLWFGTLRAQPVDSAIAARSGDIYFYSPEQLDGARGTAAKRNLYVWRDGEVRHVATLGTGGGDGASRINVSSDGRFMAFVSKTKLTPYENAGHAEMFRYAADSRTLTCVSCKPDGSPPASEVEGAQNGIFMSDDGRTFFSTGDALVPRDANGIVDVYEFVDGRPQLISTGAGETEDQFFGKIGLIGVSADGTNAFFSTFQTLVGEDENGDFAKFYVARVGGGFPYNKPPAPCAAADECHGPASSPPQAPQIGSAARLGAGGNATHPRRKAKKRRRGRHRRRGAGHGGHGAMHIQGGRFDE